MSTNLENLIGKTVTFKVGSTPGSGTIRGITITPSMDTKARLGFVADQAANNVIVPVSSDHGKVVDVNVTGGGKRRKTMKKRKSKY
jgi:hypothetical protein